MTNDGESGRPRRAGHPSADLAPDEHARRAASFGAAAAAYAEHRPDYPPAAIRWVLAPLAATGPAGATGHPLRILDLAAGTGKLTAQLATPDITGQPASVVAVEPDPLMLAELRRHLPAVAALAGSAEAIPLADGSADAVFIGQAAHWFDLDLALPELARVLRPGGMLAALWNGIDDRVDWVAGLNIATSRTPDEGTSGRPESTRDSITGWLGPGGRAGFGPPARAGFDHALPRTASSLIETLRTHSNYLTGDPAATETTLSRVRQYLSTRPETADGEFQLPLYTHVVRAARLR